MSVYTDITEDEIRKTLARCEEIGDAPGSDFPDCTYEDGVVSALNWVLGIEMNPLED